MSMDMGQQMTYGERCQLAATDQHLDPIADDLWRVGIEYDVQNLGGYCMGIICRRGDRVAVTTTWNGNGNTATVGLYMYDGWMDGGDPLTIREDVAMADVTETIANLLDGVAR